MKVLVTGSSGHLGEALVRNLIKENLEFTSIDIYPSEFTSHVGSITDRAFVKACMKGVDAILHAATLHKPHVATHSNQDFIDTNVTGTLNLLEEAILAGVKRFVYTSSTSTFGDALVPSKGSPAVWITEDVTPIPKNIYGVTKTSAEDLCKLFHRNKGLSCIVLKTSRFFPEEDDQELLRNGYQDANLKANEFLYRRVDIEDVVSAHFHAMSKAEKIGFATYIISATTPFTKDDLNDLAQDAHHVVKKLFPHYEGIYQRHGFKMLPTIERVYVNDLARNELGWNPKHDFGSILNSLQIGESITSPLAQAIGVKGYHVQKFDAGPYPV
jgi:nucleoside-diphosphate-sugar epimerase